MAEGNRATIGSEPPDRRSLLPITFGRRPILPIHPPHQRIGYHHLLPSPNGFFSKARTRFITECHHPCLEKIGTDLSSTSLERVGRALWFQVQESKNHGKQKPMGKLFGNRKYQLVLLPHVASSTPDGLCTSARTHSHQRDESRPQVLGDIG